MRDLPRRMHFKDGGFYRVFRNKWTFLGNDRMTALALFRRVEHGLPTDVPGLAACFAMERYIPTVLWRAKRNARHREIAFELTKEQFREMVIRSRACCEVTGIPFELDIRPGSARRPFSPSLDRIDAHKPYVFENCRLVCCIVNAALSDWGDNIFWKMVKTARRLRSPQKK